MLICTIRYGGPGSASIRHVRARAVSAGSPGSASIRHARTRAVSAGSGSGPWWGVSGAVVTRGLMGGGSLIPVRCKPGCLFSFILSDILNIRRSFLSALSIRM